jgi:hypothetical protein
VKGSEVSIVIGVVSVEINRLKAAEKGRVMMLDRDERRDRAISPPLIRRFSGESHYPTAIILAKKNAHVVAIPPRR